MKIMLADADDDFRSLLAEAITRENDLEVCGNTGDGEEALRLLDELQPDVLLMDLLHRELWAGTAAAASTERREKDPLFSCSLDSFVEA